MAQKLGNLQADASLDTSDFTAGAKTLNKTMNDIAKTATDGNGRIRKENFKTRQEYAAYKKSLMDVREQAKRTAETLDFFKKSFVGAFAFDRIKDGIRSLSGELIAVERQNSSFEILAGGVRKGREEMQRIIELAQGGQLVAPLEELTQSFGTLKARGLDPSNRALISYSNTAIATGKSLDQMIEAVADAVTGEFERLKEFGIKSKTQGDKIVFTFQGVSTSVGKSASEIQDYLLKIGETQFAGAAAAQAQQLEGAVGALRTEWSLFVRDLENAGVGELFAGMARSAQRNLSAIRNAIKGDGSVETGATGWHKDRFAWNALGFEKTTKSSNAKEVERALVDAQEMRDGIIKNIEKDTEAYEKAARGLDMQRNYANEIIKAYAGDRSGLDFSKKLEELQEKAIVQSLANAKKASIDAQQKNLEQLKGIISEQEKHLAEMQAAAKGTAEDVKNIGAGASRAGTAKIKTDLEAGAKAAERIRDNLYAPSSSNVLPFPVLKPSAPERVDPSALKRDTYAGLSDGFRLADRDVSTFGDDLRDAAKEGLKEAFSSMAAGRSEGGFNFLTFLRGAVSRAGEKQLDGFVDKGMDWLGKVGKSIFSPAAAAVAGKVTTTFPSLSLPEGEFGPQPNNAALLSGAGFRASGGPVAAGSPYIVGERGAELFVPSQSGRIVPHAGSFRASSGQIVAEMQRKLASVRARNM